MRRIILMLLLLACPVLSDAATRYAHPSGGGGACTNSAAPCSLGNAYNSLGNGDTLMLQGGTYTDETEFLIVPSDVLVRVETGATVTLRRLGTDAGNNAHIDGRDGTLIFDGIAGPAKGLPNSPDGINVALGCNKDRSGHIFENFEIKNYYEQAILCESNNITVRNVHIHNIGMVNGNPNNLNCFVQTEGAEYPQDHKCHAIYLGGSGWLIEKNTIHDIEGMCVHVHQTRGIDNSIIRNNVCRRFGGIGVGFFVHSPNVQVYNNEFAFDRGGPGSAAGGNGIELNSSYGGIYNNTIIGALQAGIRINGGNPSILKNNILDQNGDEPVTIVGGGSINCPTNLCSQSGSCCSSVGNPGFVSEFGNDFHIKEFGSPANAGENLSGIIPPTDLEGLSRPSLGPWTMGAYQFAAGPPPPNPDPGTIVADYSFDAGSGTTVNDSTTYNNVGTWTECAGNACWTTGITGPFAGNFNGTRAVQITDTTGLKPTGAIALVARIRLTATGVNGCDVVTIGDSAKIHANPDGNVSGQVYVAGTWREPFSSGVNVLTGTNRLLSMSYNGTDIRIYLDGAQVAFQAVTGPISYTLGPDAWIGRHGNNETTYGCTGVIDHVRILNGYCNAFCQANFFNETVPVVGLSIAHTGWYSTGVVGSSSEIARDATLLNWLITTPLALRFALRKNDPGSLTEYFPPVCIVDTGAGFPPWSAAVALTNSFGALGIRYYADAAITQGQATSVLLPTDGSTPVAGKILKNPIAAAPYPANQKVTIAQGQQADVQIQLEFGSPLVGGNRVQCRLVRENDVDLTGYANIYPVRLQGIAPPTSLRVGTTQQGGTFQ